MILNNGQQGKPSILFNTKKIKKNQQYSTPTTNSTAKPHARIHQQMPSLEQLKRESKTIFKVTKLNRYEYQRERQQRLEKGYLLKESRFVAEYLDD